MKHPLCSSLVALAAVVGLSSPAFGDTDVVALSYVDPDFRGGWSFNLGNCNLLLATLGGVPDDLVREAIGCSVPAQFDFLGGTHGLSKRPAGGVHRMIMGVVS